MSFSFDTLAYAKRLAQGGWTKEQAEAIAEATRDALSNGAGNLVTKADLAELKSELLKWMFAQTLAIAGLVIALVKLL